MLGRPTLDEALLAVFAIVVFAIVQLGSNSDGGVALPEATPTATPRAAAPAATATPSVVASSGAATPTATATPSATAPLTVAATPSATPATPKDPDSCDFRDELERVRGAVVLIKAGGYQGTGFHIGGGQYVTAAHVVQDESGRTHPVIRVESYVSERSESAEVVRVGSFSRSSGNWKRDLALLRAAPIDDSIYYREPTEQDIDLVVRALGYSWSQAEDESTDVQRPAVVRGVLSSRAVQDGVELVQSDARTGSGMSGGPLVDECGVALAVTSGRYKQPSEASGEALGVFISMAELGKLR